MYSYGTTDFELKGKNIVSKLFCGITNWIGHILSDIAGYGTFCGVDFGGALISSKGKFDIEYYCIGSGPKRLDFYKILLQHHQR